MAGKTLYDKLWESHLVRTEADGTAMIYIDRHLVHEVTSPQAYEGLKLAGRPVWRVDSVVATAANVHDKHPLPNLLHGAERRVYADAGYAGQESVIKQLAPQARAFITATATRCGPPS